MRPIKYHKSLTVGDQSFEMTDYDYDFENYETVHYNLENVTIQDNFYISTSWSEKTTISWWFVVDLPN